MKRKWGHGFSLVELLVCVAIISILAAMYMAALSKARRKAEEVVVTEGVRQENIGKFADVANMANPQSGLPTERGSYQAAFRKQIPANPKPFWATELLCEIEDERAFRAYWNTVINPKAEGNLEFRNGALVAKDDNGTEFLLKPYVPMARMGFPIPVSWEFISTDLSETSSGTASTTVRFSDGHVEYMRYPGNYPACSTVATLSHYFIKDRK